MNKMNKANSLYFLLILNLLISSSAVAEEEIRIGWIGPLTGDSAFLGTDSAWVAKDVFDTSNATAESKTKIKFIANDDRMETPLAITSYKKLVAVDKVKVIFILNYGGMLALSKDAEKDNVLLINPLDCDEDLAKLPRNSFCVAKKTEDMGAKLAEHVVKNNIGPTAIVYFEVDPFKPKAALAAKAVLEKAGIKIPVFEGVSSGTNDFRPFVIKAKQYQVNSFLFLGDDPFGNGFKQARQLGFKGQLYTFAADLNSQGFRSLANDAIEGAIGTNWLAPRNEKYQKYLENFTQKTGRAPLIDVATVPTYDLANIIAQAVNKSDTALSTDQLRDYLYSLKNYQGVSGNISMEPDGAVRSLNVGLVQYREGKVERID